MFRTEPLRAVVAALLVSVMGASGAARTLAAESTARILVTSGEPHFVPRDGELVVVCGKAFAAVVPAVLAPGAGGDKPVEGTPAVLPGWVLGAEVSLPKQCQTLEFFGRFHGSAGERFQTGVETASIDDPDLVLNNTQLLQSSTLELRKGVRTLELKLRETGDEERRLKADADPILNIGRMVEARTTGNEKPALQDTAIERSRAELERALEALRGDPPPADYLLRERALTAVLRDMTLASHDAVATERARRERGESEVERKLALIQATRFEDLELLRNELRSVQERRKRLELEAGIRDSEE